MTKVLLFLAISAALASAAPAQTFPYAQADLPAISGSGNFSPSDPKTRLDQQFNTLAAAGAHAVRINIYPFDYYGNGAPMPERLDNLVLQAHERGVQTIVVLFEYYGKFGKSPEAAMQLGNEDKWKEIGQAYARRFDPNSAFLASHGIRDWGITIYEAMNEPDIGDPTIAFTGPSSYVAALKGLAEGTHSVDPNLAVIPGGLASANERSSYTLGGYGPAIAPLLNDGTLDGIDLHTYNDIRWAPLIDADGNARWDHSPQSDFDNIKKACGITRDIDFYTTEYNFKSNEQGIDEDLAAKRLLTCIWANLGVVKSDGHTPATKLALIWSLYNLSSSDPTYGLTLESNPPKLSARGKTFQLVMSLIAGMKFTHLDPLGRGEFTLSGKGKTLWVWQNYLHFSSTHGKQYTVMAIPNSAKSLEIYGWNGLRQSIPLTGQTSVTFSNLAENETYMLLAKP